MDPHAESGHGLLTKNLRCFFSPSQVYSQNCLWHEISHRVLLGQCMCSFVSVCTSMSVGLQTVAEHGEMSGDVEVFCYLHYCVHYVFVAAYVNICF